MILPTEFQILLGLLVAYYSLVMLGLLVGIHRLHFEPSPSKPSVSVIVAARNEENKIEQLLDHLMKQDYSFYEVIIVNDRSTDGTASIIQRYQTKFPAVRSLEVHSVPTEMPAKKNALANGIAVSKGEILCFTDADCSPPPGWISSLVRAFDEKTGLAAGYSPYVASSSDGQRPATTAPGMLLRFIEYEEYKGAVWSAGAIGMQRAWLCTGRSLAYRRRVYDEVGGFEKIKQSISGDDDLFLQLVRRSTSWEIRYVTDQASFVPTLAPSSFDEFVQQRIRHFSAGKYFPPMMKLFFFIFHAANLLIVLTFLASLFAGLTIPLVWPLLWKCVIDAVLFFDTAPVFGLRRFTFSFLLMEAFYVLYNSFIGPLGLIKNFDWKPDRNR
jgi:cellulose synthase/poly-beta-1,6-N-acetylglucosamine synthase-like glycosyltransferase